MRSLKKRVVSLVSAIAMAITMLPSASLFASAAAADGVTISLKKSSGGDGPDIFTNWSEEYKDKFVDSTTKEYQAGYKNGDDAKVRSQYEFDANQAYTFTLDVALNNETAVRDMPQLQIGNKDYGQFPMATITEEMRNDHSKLPAGYEWKDDGYFVYKPTLTVTPTEGGYKEIHLYFKNDDKDKVGFKALSIVKGSTGGRG
ncbi:MAG: hypothetical protein Q4D35_01660 [Ruminococcus sp.]|nr:hypothetical protein [Ruminococcus sp.]